jgi:hypothetical protein
MSRIVDAREHDCRVMEGMVKGRDAEIDRLRRELAEEVELARVLAEKLEADRKQLAEAQGLLRRVEPASDGNDSMAMLIDSIDAFLAEKESKR